MQCSIKVFQRLTLCMAAFGVLLSPALARAQGQAPPEPPKNLKVLPKDMTRGQVVAVMRGFTDALGVGCDFCHTVEQGKQPDFSTDDKPTKEVARLMMTMVGDLNKKYISDAAAARKEKRDPKDTVVTMRCATCHRGQAEPRLVPDLLAEVIKDGGTDAATAKYNELRKTWYGSDSYDFSARSLNTLADALITQNKADDAMTMLRLNLQYNANSDEAYLLMGQAAIQKKDREAAIGFLQKALALNPQNARAQQALNGLTGQGRGGPGGGAPAGGVPAGRGGQP